MTTSRRSAECVAHMAYASSRYLSQSVAVILIRVLCDDSKATLYTRLSQLGITDEEVMNSHCKEMLDLWSAGGVRLVPERAG